MFDITAIINHPLTLVAVLVGGMAVNTLIATHQTDRAVLARLDQIEVRMGRMENRMARMETRMESIETQVQDNGRRLDALTVQVQENGKQIAVLGERITRLHPETALR